MTLDHGFVQALDLLLGGIDRVPVVPVMINCGGDLRPPFRRVAALGRAVGEALRGCGGRRVLLLGSGGLSHDPPLPEFLRSPPEVQERIIEGTRYTPELLEQRTDRVHRAAIDFAGANSQGLLPLDPAWDGWILDRVLAGDLAALEDLDDAEVRRVGGRGAAEIRNWLAALAAMHVAAGSARVELDYYRAVPELICGYGMVHGTALS
jgi:2,3-dihydroxyphenylpropionate 1,2-dioxygenase